jgi:hypothetical protein
MDSVRNLIESLMPAVVLGVFGGLARIGKKGFRGLRQLGGGLIVSAFAGVVVHLWLADSGLSENVRAGMVGVSGYGGGAILDAFAERVISGIRQVPVPGAGMSVRGHHYTPDAGEGERDETNDER